MIWKLINFSTKYKWVGSSWSYWDYIWLQELWLDIITKWENYDYIVFSMSNFVLAWWVLWDATKDWLAELKKANERWIPVLCLFLDFKTYTWKLWESSTMRKKYPEIVKEFELLDNQDNWYLLSYTRDIEKFKNFVSSQKNKIKFKPENIMYFNNMSFRYYHPMNINNEHNWKICYIGNWRWWERNEFLWRFYWFDIFWRRKPKNKEWLLHVFNWLIKQTDVKITMNKYFWHIVTYDKKWIDYNVDITRLVYTIASWCLPLIDSRLKYLDLPEFFDELYISNMEDINRILLFDNDKRKSLIEKMQHFFDNSISKEQELDKIQKIINK